MPLCYHKVCPNVTNFFAGNLDFCKKLKKMNRPKWHFQNKEVPGNILESNSQITFHTDYRY